MKRLVGGGRNEILNERESERAGHQVKPEAIPRANISRVHEVRNGTEKGMLSFTKSAGIGAKGEGGGPERHEAGRRRTRQSHFRHRRKAEEREGKGEPIMAKS